MKLCVVRASLSYCWPVYFAFHLRVMAISKLPRTRHDRHPGTSAPTYNLPPIVVTATRTKIAPKSSTSYLTIFTQQDVTQSPALVLDDALRQIPGFNTFRRSSSIVTAPADDPEAQGVTLRGIGPGGASRALVLLDGIPVNDAFGGWIYWDEIPLNSIDRVEVVEGGGTNLWGNQAEGGVINIISKRPESNGIGVQGSYGNHNTTQDALSSVYAFGPVRLTLRNLTFSTPMVGTSCRAAIGGRRPQFKFDS